MFSDQKQAPGDTRCVKAPSGRADFITRSPASSHKTTFRNKKNITVFKRTGQVKRDGL